ncbi:MAG: OsmC family protein [Kiritimatiellae bacterium]|nr:OsmC family protein [Kiritimatiellia bacterium]
MPNVKKVTVTAHQTESMRMDLQARHHRMIIDQPATGGGQDAGPTPLEYFVAALAGCMGAIGRIVARQQKLNIRWMDFVVEGDIDVDGLLGRPTPNRVGFQGFTVKARIDGDLSMDQKQAFLRAVEQRCPVSENIANATPIRFEVVEDLGGIKGPAV